MLTKDQITELLYQAKDMVDLTSKKASDLKIGDTIKEELYNSSNGIQSILNNIFSTQGIATDQQLNDLDEQMRLAKMRLLDAQSKMNIQKMIIYSGVGVIAFGILWYLTKN
jgi:hypothetical protein